MRRRRFLGALAAGAAAAALPGRLVAAPRRRPEPRVRPHYVIQILLFGGFDALLSVDAKDPSQLGDAVDCCYRADERVRGSRRLFGPLIGALARHDESLCILNGVRVDTVSHDFGINAILRGHLYFTPSTPLYGDVLGEALPGDAPLVHLTTATRAPRGAQPLATMVPRGFVRALVGADAGKPRPAVGRWPGDELVAAEREAEARRLIHDPVELEEYLAAERRSRALDALLASVTPVPGFADPHLGPQLSLALAALRHNAARSLFVSTAPAWFDSHSNHLAQQTRTLLPAMHDLARFIDLLQSERNEFGPLWEQTTLFIGSELGRFPKLNGAQGKDHWPENSWILAGRGIKGGVTIGATDEQLRGIGADYDSGRADGDGRRPLTIDTVYATILHLAGGDPRRHGYDRDSVLHAALA